MFKWMYVLVVSLMLLSFTLFVFGSDNTVTIWSWRSQDAPVWQKVQKVLNSRGIPVKIKFTAFEATQYDSKVNLALQTGTGPDIVYSRRLPGTRTESLIKAGLYLPLNGKVDFSHFPDTILKSVTYKNKIYGVPFAVQVVGIFYNKDIYKKYNLSVPRTWDELVNNAKILKSHGVTPFFVSGKHAWSLTMQHAMCGVSILGPEWIKKLTLGETDFLDPKWTQLNTLLNNLKKYYQPGFLGNSTQDMDAAFAFGQAAMIFYGIWGYQIWIKLNPNFHPGYFMVPPLTRDQKPWAYTYMDGAFALTSNTKNPDMALKVLRFTATPEFGTIFASITYNIPAVSGAKLPDVPILKKAVDIYQHHASPYVYWVGSVFVTGTPSLYGGVLSPGMQAMYAGKITPEELSKMAQDAISQWYKPLRKRLGLEK